jgi:L-lactate dehydrogenase complex protein LldE
MTNTRRRVALFVTCLVDQIYPQVGLAAARLLERFGCDVVVPEGLLCCGQMGFNAGFRAEARLVAGRTLELLNTTDAVVLPSGSCAAMIRHMYHELFHNTPHAQRAEQLAARTYELTEFLVDQLGVTDTGATFAGTIAYHDACHGLRYLGLGLQARTLLSTVRGAQLVALPDADVCCGFGGLFAVKHAAISEAMLGQKIQNVARANCDLLVTGDVSCLTQIAGGLSRNQQRTRACHIAELLAGTLDAPALD